MTTKNNERLALERVPTRVTGLDEILHGGFLRGGVYIVQGSPGAGKTILGNEICFRHAAAGGRAAYITLLAEAHTRMLQHLRLMSFFDETAIPDRLYYVSAFRTLEEEGLKGLITLLRREIKGHRADLLILDGLVVVEEIAESNREFKKFIYELQAHASANACTILMLTTAGLRNVSAEHTIVDGLIELQDEGFEVRTQRSLQVRKFRGSAVLRGRHSFRITLDGIKIFPRIEAAFALPTVADAPIKGRVTTGIAGLDGMLKGGLPVGTTTGIIGPSGVGKTTTGLHFVSAAAPSERTLFFGFYEPPERLQMKAAGFDLGLAAAVERGDTEILWRPQGECLIDELAHHMLDTVRRRKVKRLFIDGLGGLLESAIYPHRISRFLSCLANELRVREVTTLFTMETRELFGGVLKVPTDGISSLVENLLLMRYVEHQGSLHRLVSVMKLRDSDFDHTLRRFSITDGGIVTGSGFQGVEDLVTGVAHERKTPAGPPGTTG